jgi:phosphoribosylglycinamide formyltransferase-1
MNRIAILASGSGSNAENIALYFNENPQVKIVSILSNNPKAFVVTRAKKLGIPSFIFSKSDFNATNIVLDYLEKMDVDFIVLAGFLLLLPENLIKKYPDRIINIHPALLPKYGGKGMYGMNVHRAVIENKEKESGITIHKVSEKYDEGEVIFQAKCEVLHTDTAEDVAQKIHRLEYEHFPKVIEQLLNLNSK